MVAHRGASGHRPEHTLEAYRLAIRMGADDIELDLVPTRDGVLVARHEPELGTTTDVASRPEFADRRKTKTIGGVDRTGWFVEDFTLAELKVLTARERFPDLRPGSAAYDGQCGIPSFNEVLAMVHAESVLADRTVGVMAEIKHPAHYDALGLPLDVPLLADLQRHGLDHPRSRVTVMSFEAGFLRRVAARTRVTVVQLLDRGNDWTPGGLDEIEEYADGLGVHRSLIMPCDAAGEVGVPTRLVREAHRRWLTVHVWTLRHENRFLPAALRSGDDPGVRGDLRAEAQLFLDAGVDGLITDHPEVVLDVVRERVGPVTVGRQEVMPA